MGFHKGEFRLFITNEMKWKWYFKQATEILRVIDRIIVRQIETKIPWLSWADLKRLFAFVDFDWIRTSDKSEYVMLCYWKEQEQSEMKILFPCDFIHSFLCVVLIWELFLELLKLISTRFFESDNNSNHLRIKYFAEDNKNSFFSVPTKYFEHRI